MTAPVVEIPHACIATRPKVLCVEVVVSSSPLLLNGLRTVTSKIVKLAKLLADSSAVEFVTHWVPVNTALPVVVVSVSILAALTHDKLGKHGRTRAKFIRYCFHSIWGKVHGGVGRLVV